MTQTQAILAHLKSHRTITPLEALNRFGCFRAAARICEIRNLGYIITTRMVGEGRAKFAEYELVSK